MFSRFLAAIFLIWLAILLVPEKSRSNTDGVRERIFMSRSCTDSRWYLEDSDEDSVTLRCYALDDSK